MSSASVPPFEPPVERWRRYLRRDPTRWLLTTDDPSILLWYQLDLAHRPETAPIVQETREQVLYSTPVQTLFAAQDELGFWGRPDTLSQPYYRGTLWNLALLAELGIPRHSRRARAACEYALQFQSEAGLIEGLDAVEAGYLVRALAYFLPEDARVRRAARALVEHAARAGSFETHLLALWGAHPFRADPVTAARTRDLSACVLDFIGTHQGYAALCFPQFDPRDPLFVLRVLGEYDRLQDARATPWLDNLAARQDEEGRWRLEQSLNDQLLIRLEEAGAPSRWITLNALRVITKWVLGGKSAED